MVLMWKILYQVQGSSWCIYIYIYIPLYPNWPLAIESGIAENTPWILTICPRKVGGCWTAISAIVNNGYPSLLLSQIHHSGWIVTKFGHLEDSLCDPSFDVTTCRKKNHQKIGSSQETLGESTSIALSWLWLVSGWALPLWKIMDRILSWDDEIPNIWKVIKFMFQATN